MKILIVDDDPGTLHALAMGLRSYGYHVVSAESGKRAMEQILLSLIETDPVRLLITDFRMPEMHGLQLIQEAKQALPSLITILITGYGSEGIRGESKHKEVDAYIEKPFAPNHLVQQIRDLVDLSHKDDNKSERK